MNIAGNAATATTATNVAGGAANQIHYQTAAATTGFISSANNGVLVTNGSGVPSISTTLPALSISGQLTSTVATGTAPLVVTSTTPVTNLNIAGNAATATKATNVAGGGTNYLPYQTAPGTTGFILPANNGVLVTNGSGVPSISTTLPSGVTATTQTAGNNSTALATTAFVASSFAPLASPTFTGTPTLPTGTIATTQTAGNNTTAVATTAFVTNAVASSTISMGAIGSTANANGGSIASGVLTLQPASASFGGVVTTGTQSFAGAKTFNSNLTVSGATLGVGSSNTSTSFGISALNPGNATNSTAFGSSNLTNNTGTNNTGVGYLALSANTSGTGNTAIGEAALNGITTASNNSAIGLGALSNNSSGSGNTGLGTNTGGGNSTGSNNTFIGYAAHTYTDGLTNSTSIGYNAQTDASNQIQLGNNLITNVRTSGSISAGGNITANGVSIGTTSSGSTNTLMGQNALSAGGGSNSTAVGYYALNLCNGGQNNTALGWNTMVNQTNGSYNTGLGTQAMYSNISGSYNTSVGQSALSSNTLGSNNTAIGYNADVASNNLSNATAIGNGASVTASNYIQLGNGSVTKVVTSGSVVAAGTTLTSDIRLKRNILPLTKSLDLLLKLKPVSYEKKTSLTSTDYSIKENGFIAQELQKVFPTLVTEGTDKDKLLSVNYTALIPVLTKAMQEQQSEIATQKTQIAAQQKQIDELKSLVDKLVNKK